MIDFDFEYHRPHSIKEALQLMDPKKGKSNMYVGGSTEFISRARMNEINPAAIVDIKSIPECCELKKQADKLIIGAAVTLNQIIDSDLFPLLTEVCRSIASRTARNKITIGGNILSNLPYREAILPLLLADGEAVIATSDGMEHRKINTVSQLADDEMLVQVQVNKKYLNAPFQYRRKTKQSNINYPIVTAVALSLENEWHYAFSGMCSMPFYEKKMNHALNRLSSVDEADMTELMDLIPEEVLDDMNASREFRIYLCRTVLNQMLMEREAK